MAISLQKGGNVSLSKEAPGMQKMLIGLGWDVRATDGADFDLDGSAFLLGADGKVRSDADFIFYNQAKSADGSVTHTGDNRTGAGDGDDEQIAVALNRVPADIKSLVFTVSNYTGQDFSQVENAFCRLINGDNGQEIARYDLSAQGNHTAQIMAKVYRHNGEWKMHAIGENSQGATPDKIIPKILPHL